MNGLVRCVSVSFRSLTSTEKGEHGLCEVQLHNVFDGETAILQQDCALQRIRVLKAMACEVKDVRRCAF
jgi:hypothetical protein